MMSPWIEQTANRLAGAGFMLADWLLVATNGNGDADALFDDRFLGKLAFAAVFAALVVWLLLIPAERLGHLPERPPWYRNVRIWAIVVAGTQVLVYLLWP